MLCLKKMPARSGAETQCVEERVFHHTANLNVQVKSMKIEFRSMGGIGFFPGLNKPVRIDVEALPENEAMSLRRLLTNANFYHLPKTVGRAAPGAADYKQYAIAIEEGETRHRVTIIEPINDPELRALVDFLKEQVKAAK